MGTVARIPSSAAAERCAPAERRPVGVDCGSQRVDHRLVAGLGGTPLIEQYILFNEIAKLLGDRRVAITRSLVGSYITSLEMAGASVTLLVLDDELTGASHSAVRTAALRWGV